MSYMVKWRLFNTCNFRCSYCIRDKARDSAPHSLTDSDMERIRSHGEMLLPLIRDIDRDEFKISLVGGEITLLSTEDFISVAGGLVKGLVESGKRVPRVSLTSNFSAPNEWYIKASKALSSYGSRLVCTMSFHPEYFRWKDFRDKAESLASSLDAGRRKGINIEMVITRENIGTLAPAVIRDCEERGIRLMADYDKNGNFSLEERRLLPVNMAESSARKARLRATGSTRGCKCSGSLYQVILDPDGRISGACRKSDTIGSISEIKRIERRPCACRIDRCGLCGQLEIRRPDGTLFFSNIQEKDR